MFMDITYCN